MEREVRLLLWGATLAGGLFAIAIGLAAGDRGMVTGALACMAGGVLAAPFVARMWR